MQYVLAKQNPPILAAKINLRYVVTTPDLQGDNNSSLTVKNLVDDLKWATWFFAYKVTAPW
nr:hypothetical protein [uncultured bacterium]